MLLAGRYRHRLLGYSVVAHERPYGLLLIDESGNIHRNWTVRHSDAEWFAATWEAMPEGSDSR
jgi:hypothetical protein